MLSCGSGLPPTASRPSARIGWLLVVVWINHLLTSIGKVTQNANDILHTLVVHVVLVDGASYEVQ